MRKLFIALVVLVGSSQMAQALSGLSFSCNKPAASYKLRCDKNVAVNFPVAYLASVYNQETKLSFSCVAIAGNAIDVKARCNINYSSMFGAKARLKNITVELTSVSRAPLFTIVD